MPIEISENTFNSLTYKSKEFVNSLDEFVADKRNRVATVFGNVRKTLISTLLEEIKLAADETEEFKREELKSSLITAFSKDKIIGVTDDGIIYVDYDEAGTWGDFWDGVEAARAELEVSTKSSPKQRAVYWRTKVYPARDIWKATIDKRKEFWHNLAPYWVILDQGNTGAEGAYPKNDPTNFISKAEEGMQQEFDLGLQQFDEMFEKTLDTEINKFVDNPEDYEPFTILDTFVKSGRKYYTYVTPTKRIGTALEESFYRMRRG